MPRSCAVSIWNIKYVYLCECDLDGAGSSARYPASKFLTFSVHMDGFYAVSMIWRCAVTASDVAVKSDQAAALKRGHRVTTNTTLFDDANPGRVQEVFR